MSAEKKKKRKRVLIQKLRKERSPKREERSRRHLQASDLSQVDEKKEGRRGIGREKSRSGEWLKDNTSTRDISYRPGAREERGRGDREGNEGCTSIIGLGVARPRKRKRRENKGETTSAPPN